MQVLRRLRAGRAHADTAAGMSLHEGGGHLAPTRVVDADEQDAGGAHGGALISRKRTTSGQFGAGTDVRARGERPWTFTAEGVMMGG